MTDPTSLLNNAELLGAAYVSLQSGSTGNELNIAAMNPPSDPRGSLTKIIDLVRRDPTVVSQYDEKRDPTGMGTSSSATVFSDAGVGGNLTLAIGGTQELFGDIAPTDAEVLASGASYDQIVAMANWWLRAAIPVDHSRRWITGSRSGLVKASAIVALSATLAGCMGWVPGRQTYWDARVAELCEKDGGVEIYETLQITQAEISLLATVDGMIDLPIKQAAKPSAPAYAELKITRLREANPRISRTEATIIRARDRNIIGHWVVYTRSGGDFPSPGQGSSYTCPDLKRIVADLQPLFVVEGDSQ